MSVLVYKIEVFAELKAKGYSTYQAPERETTP